MTETPLTRLVQLVAGVAILPGPLGYRVLGNLLVLGSRSPEVAGATAALAAASRQHSSAAQIALRTIVPAVLVQVLGKREEQRLTRIAAETERQRQDLRAQSEALRRERMRDATVNAGRAARADQVRTAQLDQLRRERDALARELDTLRRSLAKPDPARVANALQQRTAEPVATGASAAVEPPPPRSHSAAGPQRTVAADPVPAPGQTDEDHAGDQGRSAKARTRSVKSTRERSG